MSERRPDVSTLDIKYDSLAADVRKVEDSILGLDAKIDKAVSSLALEVRTAISSITAQFNERQRTPWGVIFSGAAVIVTVLGFIGSQALSPLATDIKALKEQIVPREEINFRSEVANRRIITLEEVTNRRFSSLEGQAETLGKRRYDEMQNEIRELRGELRELHKQGRSP